MEWQMKKCELNLDLAVFGTECLRYLEGFMTTRSIAAKVP